MSKDDKFVRVAVKQIIHEKRQHDKKFEQVSKDISDAKKRLDERERRFDLIRNK